MPKKSQPAVATASNPTRRQALQATLALLGSNLLPAHTLPLTISTATSKVDDSGPKPQDIRTLITGYGVHAVDDYRLHESLKFEMWDGRQWVDTKHRFHWYRVGDNFVCRLWQVELTQLKHEVFNNCWAEQEVANLWTGILTVPDNFQTPLPPNGIFMAALKTLVRCSLFSTDLPGHA